MTREDYMDAVAQVKEYIQAGDIFQLVLSHRFKRRTFADPFEIYRCAASSFFESACSREDRGLRRTSDAHQTHICAMLGAGSIMRAARLHPSCYHSCCLKHDIQC